MENHGFFNDLLIGQRNVLGVAPLPFPIGRDFPNALTGELNDNDFSKNIDLCGLRCYLYAANVYYNEAEPSPSLNCTLTIIGSGNSFTHNGKYGIIVDAGWTKTDRKHPNIQYRGSFNGDAFFDSIDQRLTNNGSQGPQVLFSFQRAQGTLAKAFMYFRYHIVEDTYQYLEPGAGFLAGKESRDNADQYADYDIPDNYSLVYHATTLKGRKNKYDVFLNALDSWLKSLALKGEIPPPPLPPPELALWEIPLPLTRYQQQQGT